MNHQRKAFIDNLGDDWFERNKGDFGRVNEDPVEKLIDQFKLLGPEHAVLEVGCSNGWRMKGYAKKYGCLIFGVDPSEKAIADANHDGFRVGTADNMPFNDSSMSCVILGFVMWALDPSDWFKAVAEVDRVLKDGGLVIIHDRFAARPVRRGYPERDDIFGYSYDFKNLWLGHPGYQQIAEAAGVYPGTATIEGAVMLRKAYEHCILHCQEPPAKEEKK